MRLLFVNGGSISFIIKCEGQWVSGMYDPLLKMVKVKGDKFLGMKKRK